MVGPRAGRSSPPRAWTRTGGTHFGNGRFVMKRRGRPLLDDPELVRMLGNDPELLAIADALVDTKGAPEASRRALPVRARHSSGVHSKGAGVMRKRFVLVGLAAIASLARGTDGTLWAGTGEANASGGGITYTGDGVYKSTDNGVTWTNVGLGNAGMIGRIAVDPTNPNRVYVAASGDIYSPGGKR